MSEIEGKVVFLRKLARGGSEHSFGIHSFISTMNVDSPPEMLSLAPTRVNILSTTPMRAERLDVLSAFTMVAIENRYNRPVIDDSVDRPRNSRSGP